MVLLGVIVNAIAVILGSFFGALFKKGIPERIISTVIGGLALFVLYIGIKGAVTIEGTDALISVFSLVIGAAIGSFFDFETKLEHFAKSLQGRFSIHDQGNSFAQSFIYSSLMMCVGAMAIVGSFESGLQGVHDTLFAKAVIDGVFAMMLTTTMGIGIGFAAIPVFLYQGALALFAQALSSLLTTAVINEMSVVGSLIIIGISLNMLNLTKLRIANYILAPFIPILFMLIRH